MPIITISGVPIDFPASSASPNWSPAIIQFAELVADVINSVSGPFDVLAQSFSLDAYNSASNVDITNLTFPTSDVRAAFVTYAVHRTTNLPTEVDESGVVWFTYNDSAGSWTQSQEKSGNAQISFNITNTGQVQFSTTALSGINHEGFISFFAKAIENE